MSQDARKRVFLGFRPGPFHMSHDARKLVFWVSDQVRQKPVCAATEDGYKLEILNLRRRGIVLSV